MIDQIEDLKKQLEWDAARLDMLENEIAAGQLRAEIIRATMKIRQLCINALEDSLTLSGFRRERLEKYPPVEVKTLAVGAIEIVED